MAIAKPDESNALTLRIGAEFDSRSLTVIKSTLQLHRDDWIWVEDPKNADVWIVDLDKQAVYDDMRPDEARVLVLVTSSMDETLAPDGHFVLESPLRGNRLLKLLDRVAPLAGGAITRKTPAKATNTGSAEAANWRGRTMRFSGKPNLSRFPITKELAIWLEIMTMQTVEFDAMYHELGPERGLLKDVLNHAAECGHLIDDCGNKIAPFKKNGKLFAKLLRRRY